MVAQAQRSAHGDRLSAQARLCVETQLSKKRQIARTSQERAAIRDLIDTNSFMTNCSVKVSQALAANPGDPDLRRWHATIRAYQAKRAEGIAAIRAERAALLQRQANAEQARSSSTRMASPRSRAPGSRTTTKPCRWTTFKGTGGGRACVTE
jgi:hypothetical protein